MTKIIKDWKDLVGLESKGYYIEVDLHMGCGWIVPKEELSGHINYYLSTHTFYGSTYKSYEELLRKCGFDVEIVSWDGGQ